MLLDKCLHITAHYRRNEKYLTLLEQQLNTPIKSKVPRTKYEY